MRKVTAIPLSDGRRLYVQMEPVEVSLPPVGAAAAIGDLPEGAEPVSAWDQTVDALQAMRDNIAVVAETVRASLAEHPPEEWTLELHLGFKGKARPIPVILEGEAQGAIKITARWTRAAAGDDSA